MIAPENISQSSARRPGPPSWMRRTLLAAAAYNLLWGLLVILLPGPTQEWIGLTPADSSLIWQCLGMVIGVYGIGYAIAAVNPMAHWPIILVGLLGKIFGPIGYLWGLVTGQAPARMGWMLLTNDLIWWIPFTAILWSALKFHQSSSENAYHTGGRPLLSPLSRAVSQFGSTLLELSRRQPLLVVFLRHSGCTFCRQALADLAEQRDAIESTGTRIAVVHMGQREPESLLETHQLTDLHCFRDPSCLLYDTFGLGLASPTQLLGPKVWWQGIQAAFRGHRPGRIGGNVFRMPGAFLLHNGEIVRSYRHQSAADRPDYAALAGLPNEPECSGNDCGELVVASRTQ